ncbi:MAG TPA: Nramp family divalent metal transporter [Nitrososphaeraceae archaeon]|nr:Nramp family divalent metal transporter [Nitrososphaeraceae archaeon]
MKIKELLFFSPIVNVLRSLGPGLITGAADEDPSGIVTFLQIGSKLGLGMLWAVLLLFLMKIAIQEMCARIGLVTGKGLATLIKNKYSRNIVIPISGLLMIANIINIGVDIGAMAVSSKLIFPQLPSYIATIIFTALILLTQIFIPYVKYVKFLKYLTFSLFAYVITAVLVGGNIREIITATVIPHFEFSSDFIMLFVAMFGTTISPYLFFWQTSEEVEEDVAKNKIKEIGKGNPNISKKEIKIMKQDVAIGAFFSQFITWTIIVTTAGSLHVNGITNIESADQAAQALQPLVNTFPYSGEIAKIIFALGIMGTGLLSIPVLSASSAYALSDTFRWKEGLSKKFGQAKSFYIIIIFSTLIGLGIAIFDTNIIQALIYAAVINGAVAVPMILLIIKIGNDRSILKDKTNGLFSNVVGWITFTIMTISVIFLFLTQIKG